MRGALKIATFFKIPVYVHWTFGLLFLVLGYMGSNLQDFIFQSALLLSLFVCVVMHEYGHALSAKKYGVTTQDIIILPIGGVARLNKMPDKPIQEFIVAIAGPAVNVVIALFLGIFLYYFDTITENIDSDAIPSILSYNFLRAIVYSNIFLVVFNMIPAFPMDGGRVLRALLSLRLGRTKATKYASFLGQIFAIGFIIFSLLPLLHYVISAFSPWGDTIAFITWQAQPVLALISFFIFTTARSEYKNVVNEEKLNSHLVNQVMRMDFTPLQTSDSMHKAALELNKGHETDFLVFDDAQILRGVLQEEDIADAVKNKHFEGLVFSYTTHDYVSILPMETLKDAYYKMLSTGQYILPVLDNEKLEGVIDMASIQKYLKA